jgi:hypothetical protein
VNKLIKPKENRLITRRHPTSLTPEKNRGQASFLSANYFFAALLETLEDIPAAVSRGRNDQGS